MKQAPLFTNTCETGDMATENKIHASKLYYTVHMQFDNLTLKAQEKRTPQVSIIQISTDDWIIWLIQKAFLYVTYLSPIEKKYVFGLSPVGKEDNIYDRKC